MPIDIKTNLLNNTIKIIMQASSRREILRQFVAIHQSPMTCLADPLSHPLPPKMKNNMTPQAPQSLIMVKKISL